jgi:predicted transcriptional regulator
MARTTKNVLLRLDPGLAERLELVAEVEGRSVSDVARDAIERLVEAKQRDRGFLRSVEDNVARYQRLLDELRERERAPER